MCGLSYRYSRHMEINTRKANVAGSFYPDDLPELQSIIDQALAQAHPIPKSIEKKRIRAIISPHAGYIYCSSVMGSVYRTLKKQNYQRVILLAPSHYVSFSCIALDTHKMWQMPLGTISIDQKVSRQLSKDDVFRFLPEAFDEEHSLEVQLPFLQTVLSSFQLIPLCCGQDLPSEHIAHMLQPYIGHDTLLVASSDLSHYLPEDKAMETDKETTESIISLGSKRIARQADACGIEAIKILNSIANTYGWQPRCIHHTTSAEASGETQRVVGYGGFIYV